MTNKNNNNFHCSLTSRRTDVEVGPFVSYLVVEHVLEGAEMHLTGDQRLDHVPIARMNPQDATATRDKAPLVQVARIEVHAVFTYGEGKLLLGLLFISVQAVLLQSMITSLRIVSICEGYF